jgi:glucan biosynthesis protein
MKREALFFRKKKNEPKMTSIIIEYPLAIDMIQSGVSLYEMKSALKMRGVVKDMKFMGVDFRTMIDMDYNKKTISFKISYDPMTSSERDIDRVIKEFKKRIAQESGYQGMRKNANQAAALIKDMKAIGASDRRIIVTLVDKMDIDPLNARSLLLRYK